MQPKQEFESDLANKNEIPLKRPYFLMTYVLQTLPFKRNNITPPPTPPHQNSQNDTLYYWLSEQVSAFIGLSQLILSTSGKTLLCIFCF